MAKLPKNVDEFVSYKFKEYLKVYLVFRFKGYSWKKELQNEFSIADSIVNEGLKILEKEGFLISKDFWSLDLDMQEIIRRLNGAYFDKISAFPKIYILNQDDIKEGWWESYKDEVENLIKGDGSMNHTLKLIEDKKKAYEKLQNLFNDLESSRLERERIDWESGISYITETKKAKFLKKEIEKNRILKLNSNTNKDLVLKNKTFLSQIREYTLNDVPISKSYFDEKEKELLEIKKLDLNYEKELKKDEKIKSAINETIKNFSNDKNIHFSKIPDLIHIKGFGKFPEELDSLAKENLEMWEKLLNLENSKKNDFFESKDEKEMADKISDFLIKKLKEKKRLDFFFVQSTCGNENFFRYFQERIKNMNVIFDGDDFILN